MRDFVNLLFFKGLLGHAIHRSFFDFDWRRIIFGLICFERDAVLVKILDQRFQIHISVIGIFDRIKIVLIALDVLHDLVQCHVIDVGRLTIAVGRGY